MKLSKNITFLRHKEQIQSVLDNLTTSAKSDGEYYFREMLVSAEELDLALTPQKGEMPSPQIVTVKRDDFHKKCRDLGTWLEANAPELKLNW